MIRPLANAPVPVAGPNVGPRKEQSTPFHDWLASQEPVPASAPASAVASPAAVIRAPGVDVVVPPAAQALTGTTRDALAESLHAPATKTPVPVLPDLMQAPTTRSAASAPFAIQLRTHSGSVELIALPWRLVATGGLAHLFASRDAAMLHHASDPRPAGATTGARACATPLPVEDGGDVCMADDDRNAASASAVVATHDAMDSADDERVAQASAQRHAALPWTARLLRWIEANGGAATLWFRDYRLEERGIPHLVATLRAAASDAGLRLDRIVINGRTHWHLHRPNRETTHAG